MNELSTEVKAKETHEKAVGYFKVFEQYGYKFIMEVRKIRDDRHYKELGFSSFEEYCNSAWGFTRQWMNAKIQSASKLNESDFDNYSFQFGIKKTFLLATMEDEQREQAINEGIPTEQGNKSIDEATQKEINEYRRKNKQLEQDKQQAQQQLTEERNKEPKIIEKLVKIDNTDYSLQNKIDKLQERYKYSERERQSLEEKVGTATEDSEQYEKMKSDLNRLHEEKDDIYRQIESATSISALYVDIEHLLQEKLAPIKYSRALTESKDSKVAMKNLKEIIEMVDNWSQEIKTYLPQSNIIDADYTTIDSK